MAKAYIGVNGSARKTNKIYIGVDGLARKVVKAYIGVNNVARLCWSSEVVPDVPPDVPVILDAGLYDANDVLLASWDTLVNTYGLNVNIVYVATDTGDNYYKTTRSSGYYVLNNYPELAGATKLIISSDVTNIGQLTFCDCSILTSVMFAEGSKLSTIGTNAFKNCTSLTEITIPSEASVIAGFSDCTSLETIKFVENGKLSELGMSVFAGCTALKNVVIPDTVTEIALGAFSDCAALKGIVIGNSVAIIGMQAFRGCTALKGVIIPESVTSLGVNAFSGCTLLETVIFRGKPNFETMVGRGNQFYNCTALKDIYVPWAQGEVAGAPWGATNATIHYNSEV